MSIDSIVTKVRNLIGDLPTSHSDIYSYNGIDFFILREANVEEITDVLVNGQSSGVTYEFTQASNKVQITPLSDFKTNDIIEIVYDCYINYSDTQLLAYITSALDYISMYYKIFVLETNMQVSGEIDIFPVPNIREESLIAIITKILINPNNVTINLPDIKISPAEKISTEKQIERQIALFKSGKLVPSIGVV